MHELFEKVAEISEETLSRAATIPVVVGCNGCDCAVHCGYACVCGCYCAFFHASVTVAVCSQAVTTAPAISEEVKQIQRKGGEADTLIM
jgi:hypothetical protein